MHAMLRDETEFVSPSKLTIHETGGRIPTPKRSDARGREQTTARIFVARGQPMTDCDFNSSRAAPSLPHQVLNEHAENAGT